MKMADGEQSQQRAAETRVDIFSTEAVGARERFSYWRDAICRSVFGISIEAAPEGFAARIAARSTGALRFAQSESIPYAIVRTARDIANESADHYSIYMQITGRTDCTLDDREVSLGTNDIGVYDGRTAFRATHSGRRAIAVLPRAMLDLRAPWLRKRPQYKLAASPYLNLARRHLLQLSAPKIGLRDTEANLLTENLCNLVALASAGSLATDRLQPDLQIQAILTFCRQNLHDAGLSPQPVADRFRISLRTVHARLARSARHSAAGCLRTGSRHAQPRCATLIRWR
jgi:AraC family transcriptional activator of tynA and feaB